MDEWTTQTILCKNSKIDKATAVYSSTYTAVNPAKESPALGVRIVAGGAGGGTWSAGYTDVHC